MNRRGDDYQPGTGRPSRNVAASEVEKHLLAGGRAIADYALLESGMPLVRGADGKWVAAFPADHNLARAAGRYLRQRGAAVLTREQALGRDR